MLGNIDIIKKYEERNLSNTPTPKKKKKRGSIPNKKKVVTLAKVRPTNYQINRSRGYRPFY